MASHHQQQQQHRQHQAQRLASILTSLGYQHDHALHQQQPPSKNTKQGTTIITTDSKISQQHLPDLLEWAFSIDSTRQFLDWLCDAFEENPPQPRSGDDAISRLGGGSLLDDDDEGQDDVVGDDLFKKMMGSGESGFAVLSEAEALAYEELVMTGTWPTPQELRNWQPDQPGLSSSSTNVSSLEAEIERLEAKLDDLIKSAKDLETNLDNLKHEKSLASRTMQSQRKAVESCLEAYEQKKLELNTTAHKVDASIHDLKKKVEELCANSKDGDVDPGTVARNRFLYQCEDGISKWKNANNALSTELMRCFERSFKNVTACVSFSIQIEVNNSNNLDESNTSVSTDDGRKEVAEELERLADVYVLTESQYAEALALSKFYETKLAALENFTWPEFEKRNIKGEIRSHQSMIKTLRHHVLQLCQDEKAKTLEELANVDVRASVANLDYQAKIGSHKDLLSRLDTFIDLLFDQQSHHQLLNIALEVEHDNVRRYAHLLESIHQEAEANLSETKGRLAWMSEARYSAEKPPKNFVDANDHFLNAVRGALGDVESSSDQESQKHDFGSVVSVDSLIKQARALSSQSAESNRDCDAREKSLLTFANTLAKSEDAVLSQLYSNSITSTPLLSSAKIYDLECEVIQRTEELRLLMRRVLKDVEQTQELIER
ncbi:hypothetical protein HDU76_001784 [Blyttiomyces sp. JEL0837]|nr:hypothetical protein HDU76_001784 [Blyttiomyces sp. JEL0837]